MSVVYTGEFNECSGLYQVLCEKCKRIVGMASRAECADLSVRDEPILCFECEGVDPVDIPPILAPELGKKLLVFEPSLGKFVFWSIDNAGAQPRYYLTIDAALCLSSSPYLHKPSQKKGGLE